MRNTSARKRRAPFSDRPALRALRRSRIRCLAAGAALALLGGCVEFVHWGHISDQDGTWGIGGVSISQQQPDGSWTHIGGTDGKGRWEVFKHKVSGGGRIRLRKRGYYTRLFSESEFLQRHMILMKASREGDYGEAGYETGQDAPD
ncbi:MAG: hypothetical protein ACE5EC_04615 [Phycisphaerae bacterium]